MRFCVLAVGAALALAVQAVPVLAQVTTADLSRVTALDDPSERVAAQDELVPGPTNDISALAHVAGSPDAPEEIRLLALFLLGESGRDDACGIVRSADVGDGDNARYVLASARASCGDPEGIRELVRDNERPVPVRLKAAVAAGLREDLTILDDVVAWIDDAEFDGYHAFVFLIRGLLGDRQVVPVLEQLVRQRATRDYAVIALVRTGDTNRLFELRFALQNEDPLVRRAALQAASGPDYAPIHASARELIEDPNAGVAAAAATLFGGRAESSAPTEGSAPVAE
jgi:hypothetical protein